MSYVIYNPSAVDRIFGTNVHRERQARGWSLREVGKRTGIAHSYIATIERAGMHVTLRHATALAEAFCMPLDYLLRGEVQDRSRQPVAQEQERAA